MLVSLFLVKLLAITVFADDRNDSTTPITRRIFYSSPARIEDYPYYAGLWNCGAVILSELWVATAAHCVSNATLRGLQLVYVGGNTKADSIKVSYNEFIIHPGWISDTYNNILVNDIALLKLTAPLKFSATVQPAKLPTSVSSDVVVVGRGLDENGHPTSDLRKVDLIVLPPYECLVVQSHFSENTTFCTKRRGPIAPIVCRGDSGSPVLNGDTLVGIHSYGLEICAHGKVAYHTNVLIFVPWIRANTGI